MGRQKSLNSVVEAIGNTPLVRLNRVVPEGSATVYAKLESFNPMGSVKDRIAKAMIEDAEEKGIINKETTIIEPTSGNTGIGLAMVCAAKGYKLILAMPETMTVERRRIMAALGAQLVLTPGPEGMSGAIKKANELAASVTNSYVPQQFENRSNPKAHMKTTAKEILKVLDRVDAFVAGVGTGGTITGVGKVLKRKNPDVKIFAVEPAESPVLSGGKPGPHRIQGIGAGFVPKILNTKVYDSVIQVAAQDAIQTSRKLARLEGIFVGISSGAAAWAALKVASELGPGKNVVVILPDLGERYLSTDLFGETSQ
ncbi:MAG: cysteine synthase A [Euryarchaeota archaeon RBG_13_57_23]|nr:MAG: cysteine synthase A [Euryarchaeota archaeon RBG_13_57_23]